MQAQGANHPEHGGELWIAVSGQCPIKSLPRHTCVARQLRHAAGACNVAQCGAGDR